MAGIYLHIPFCKQACYYCDFHFSTNMQLRESMVQAIIQEMEMRREYLQGQTINTIYFGGGTPSLLNQRQLQSILNSVHRLFPVAPQVEMTLEANPDDLTPDILRELQSLGINRLSIGIQSFHDEVLRWMNRAHSSHEGIGVVEEAHEAGFENLSLDLIYGLPIGPAERWEKDVEQMLLLDPPHISAYCLTIEPNTVFGKRHQKGAFQITDEEQIVKEYHYLTERLRGAGYNHYEVSNFGKANWYSQHNTSYWHQIHYLGLGPSAH
ncbi:MAG: radical SAM family heme chaperone HemW, partial [Bacteroidota bacterium]